MEMKSENSRITATAFDYDRMSLAEKKDMWRDVRAFCEDPCTSILYNSLDQGQYDDDWRKERWRRKQAKRELNAELQGAAQR
jgi:hypothetical protein